jgi:IclR family acetate operon transcriptional repressor
VSAGEAPGEGSQALDRAPVAMADRIFSIVEICAAAGRPLGLAELAAETGLPKSSLHRICGQLVRLGALDADGAGYEVGTRLFALGSLNPRLRRLRVVAMPYLHELVASSGRVANLAVLRDGRALLVDEVFGPRPAMPKLIGATLPLHATALGKALLGGQDPARAEELIATLPLVRFTTRTVATREALRAQVAAVAAGEPAISREEWRLGTVAIAAPVRAGGETVAALALIGGRGERELNRLRAPLLAAVHDLGTALEAAPGEMVKAA